MMLRALRPASAFCFRQGDQVLVEKGKATCMRAVLQPGRAGGETVSGPIHGRHLWMRPPGGATVKIERGSRFENFKDAGCIREVRKADS